MQRLGQWWTYIVLFVDVDQLRERLETTQETPDGARFDGGYLTCDGQIIYAQEG